MNSLPEMIPDVDFLLTMEAEELASILLPLLAKERQHAGVHFSNFSGSLFRPNVGGHQYADKNRNQIELAVAEAWNWLEVQGLLIPTPGTNGANGWRSLSRKAGAMQTSLDVTKFAQARRLRREQLHPKIAEKVWSAFIRSEFDVAAFQAMKAVEIAVREAAGFPTSDLGVTLMRKAFRTDGGPLTDMTAEASEREARVSLFVGAIGSYKNPHSHRDVDLNDPDEALEIVMLANHLLRIVDQRAATLKTEPGRSPIP